MSIMNNGDGEIGNLEMKVVVNSEAIALLNKQLEESEAKAQNWEQSYNNLLRDSTAEIEALNREVEKVTSGEQWQEMAEKAKQGTKLAEKCYEDLITFIRANGLQDILENGDWDLNYIVDQVKNGEKSIGQAISEIKLGFRELLEGGRELSSGVDLSFLQNITTSIERVSEVISNLEAKIDSMMENGVRTLGDATGGSTGGFADALRQISDASHTAGGGAETAYQPIINLVNAVGAYNDIDTEKIQAISSAFRNLAATTSNSLGDKTTNNIIKLLTDLQAATAGKPINIAMNVSGIEELKVKKTSLSNLATYLPVIAEVNVDKLKGLSNVDLTNFNNIKVSKGAVEEISKIADAIQILKEAKAASVNVNGSGITIDKTVSQALAEQKALEKEVTAATKEWEASQKAAAEQAAQVVTPLQQQINALTGVDRVAKDAKSSWEHMNFEMKEQAREAKAAAQAVAKAERDKSREINETVKYQQKATSLLAEMTKAEKNWTKSRGGQTAEQYANIQKMIPELDTLMKGFHNRDVLPPDFKARIDQLSTSFRENSTQIKAAGENTLSFGDRVQKLSGKFGAWLSITRIIMGVIRTIKQMIKTVVEIDSAMTQLQIVTKATSDTMRGFASNAAKSAKEIGSTITDFTSSVTTFARLGLTT